MTNVAFGTAYKEEQSIKNAQIVIDEVKKRFPEWSSECQPYINVLPIRAWNARGFRVKKGEKAIKVWTKIPELKKDKETGNEEITGMRNAVAHVFALPQVEPR